MSKPRVIVEWPCEHGYYDTHMTKPPVFDGPTATTMVKDGEFCRQASRRVLTAGEYLLVEKVDGEWPDFTDEEHTVAFDATCVDDVLDVLAKSEQEGTE